MGWKQPKEGGNDPEPAEPGAEVQEQGEEPGADSAHEPPEGQELSQEQEEPEDQDGGGKPAQQTKEQRAENARRRRQEEQEAAIKAAVEKALAEEREKSKADMAAFFARANLKNTVTGKPITTMEEFDAWRADYDAAKLQKDLKAGKLTPEALRSAVEQTPASRSCGSSRNSGRRQTQSKSGQPPRPRWTARSRRSTSWTPPSTVCGTFSPWRTRRSSTPL